MAAEKYRQRDGATEGTSARDDGVGVYSSERYMVVRDPHSGHTLGIESLDRLVTEAGILEDATDDDGPGRDRGGARPAADGAGAPASPKRVVPPGWLQAYPSFRSTHSGGAPAPLHTGSPVPGADNAHVHGVGAADGSPLPMLASKRLGGGRFLSQRKLDNLATTIEAAEKQATPAEARRKIKEMLLAMTFVALFSFIVVADRNDQMIFHLAESVKSLTEQPVIVSPADAHKTFESLESPLDLYAFLEGTFYPMVYEAGSFDGDSSFSPAGLGSPNQPGTIWGASHIVGGIRIGQLRVQPLPCTSVPPQLLTSGTPVCYPPFSTEVESTEPFGVGEPFNYTRGDDDSEAAFTSATSIVYPAPAFSVVLPNREDDAASVAATIRSLQTRRWVDLQTRAVFIDLAVHNFQLDRQVSIRFVIEFPVSGGAVTSVDVIALRLFQYYSTGDLLRAACEVLLMLLVFRFLALEMPKIRKRGLRRYFSKVGSFVHTGNLLMFLVVWSIRLAAHVQQPASIDLQSSEFIDLRSLMVLSRVSQDLNSLNAFFSYLKLFGYLSFMSQFSLLTTTLSRAAAQLTGFGMVFGMVMFAASQAFMLCFGANLFEYRNMTSSFFALIRALLGDFDFEGLRETNRLLGPVLFSSFVLLAVFVLLNMFIAIISESYDETKDELQELEDMKIDTLGMQIYEVFTQDFLFRIPGLRSCFARAEKAGKNARRRMSRAGDPRLIALAKVPMGHFNSPKPGQEPRAEAFPVTSGATGGADAKAAPAAGQGRSTAQIDVNEPAPRKRRGSRSRSGRSDSESEAVDAATRARLDVVEARQSEMAAKLEEIHALLLRSVGGKA